MAWTAAARGALVVLTSAFVASCAPTALLQEAELRVLAATTTATPTFDPWGGTFAADQAVAITTATPGATIRFTVDGSTPTSSHGTIYTGAISVSGTGTTKIQCVAYAGGKNDSAVANATYYIGPTYSVGDTGPAGGIVFYSNAKYLNDGWRYLEAATSDQSIASHWSYNAVTTGVVDAALGAGKANTAILAALYVSYAADVCKSLSVGGFSDWFLPSKDELNQMYLQRATIGGFAAAQYWSSTEFGASFAWGQSFVDGVAAGYFKDINYMLNVRAARRY